MDKIADMIKSGNLELLILGLRLLVEMPDKDVLEFLDTYGDYDATRLLWKDFENKRTFKVAGLWKMVRLSDKHFLSVGSYILFMSTSDDSYNQFPEEVIKLN